MKILITGGAGFAGCVLTEHLLDYNAVGFSPQITILDTFKFGYDPIMGLLRNKNVNLVKGDIRDEKLVTDLVESHNVVLHLAGIVGFPACASNPYEALSVNVEGTINIAKAIGKDHIFIYASTGSTYGKVDGICTENTPINPQSLYGETKAKAEKISLENGAVALRFATVFGVSPCMRFDLLVHALIYKALRQKHVVLYESKARRTFLHVSDMARSYSAAILYYEKMKGEAYNVGDTRFGFTKLQLAEEIVKLYPMKIITEDVGKDKDQRDYAVDYRKFYNATGFEGKADLKSGLCNVGKIASIVELGAHYRYEV